MKSVQQVTVANVLIQQFVNRKVNHWYSFAPKLVNILFFTQKRHEPKSKYRLIFDSLLEGRFQAVISNEILTEYVEIIEKTTNAIVAHNIAESITNLP